MSAYNFNRGRRRFVGPKLCDKEPDIAPGLIPLREKLQAMVNRPVNIQATRDFVRFVREELLGEPHLHLFEITD